MACTGCGRVIEVGEARWNARLPEEWHWECAKLRPELRATVDNPVASIVNTELALRSLRRAIADAGQGSPSSSRARRP